MPTEARLLFNRLKNPNSAVAMEFKRNGRDAQIFVGSLTHERLLVAALYRDSQTNDPKVVLTVQRHLSDWASWYEGKEMIADFNEKGKYRDCDIKHFGEFNYPDGCYSGPVDVLYLMYKNQEEIGGFAPTASNKNGCVWGKESGFSEADYHNFTDGNAGYSDKSYKAAIHPVVVVDPLTVFTI